MHATRRVKLKDISSNLTCHLCKGYFIDATTIIECLHSFCRSCIVQHLEKSEYCPVCDVQLHSSKPLSSIRSDQMLQEIVYKLVPGLFQNEMIRRRKHYKEHTEVKPTSQQDAGHVYNESYITSDDIIHLSLELQTDKRNIRESSKRYIKCPAAVSISILKKLLQGKYDLNSSTSIDILYRDRTLPDDFLLMDIAYKYFWSQNDGKPLQLCFKFRGFKPELKIPKPLLPAATVTTTPKRKSSITTKTKLSSTPLTEPTVKKPKKTPVPKSPATPLNGKLPRGRPKRKLSIEAEDGVLIKPEEKKPKKIKEVKEKVPKDKLSKVPKQRKSAKAKELRESNGIESAVAEVQLRISENGVISATSVSSGEEKIIVKNPVPLVATSPTLLSAYPHHFNGNTPSPTCHAAMNGNPLGLNGNHHDLETPKKSFSPENPKSIPAKIPNDSATARNGEGLYPWKFSPEDLTRKQSNGKLNHDTLNKLDDKDKPKTPSKRHQTTIINGDFKFTPIIVPPAQTPPKNNGSAVSSPKKPPKFFKSRHTEMRTTGTETNREINGKSPPKFPENRSPFKIPTSTKSDQIMTTTTATSTPTTSTPTTSFSPSSSMLDHFAAGFRFPMNMNMNLGLQNNLPMNLVPFVTNNYCSMPFYNGPRPTVATNALMANALAMSAMNMNLPYSAFQAQANNPNNFRQQTNSPNPNTTLDLSMSNRKPVSSYVQISPKKSQREPAQKEPLSLKVSQKSPVKRDKEMRKTPKKSQIVPQNGSPKPTNSNSPDKTPVPAPLSTIQTDALDFCHNVREKESVTVPVTSAEVLKSPTHNNNNVSDKPINGSEPQPDDLTQHKLKIQKTSENGPEAIYDSPSVNPARLMTAPLVCSLSDPEKEMDGMSHLEKSRIAMHNSQIALDKSRLALKNSRLAFENSRNGLENSRLASSTSPSSATPQITLNEHTGRLSSEEDNEVSENINLNSPSSSFSPTNNNNNIPAPTSNKLDPLSEAMDIDSDRLIISECDTNISTSCSPAVSVNVISSSNTSSA